MAEDFAIKVEHVSKSFKLPHEKQSSIKGSLINFHKRGYEKQEVLKDINLEIKKGEFFGIVGRNGSGKSTLLKLLAGIYTADEGHITVNGKITPFIELGVGFNEELTGRENVFLNGALFGFSRKEMEAMYPDIVAFAELERFMDQKLKNYSSGMQVRLAFSIAIRAESDILILDEVLAVGDEAFQRKCNEYFASMKDDEAKTIVLVTHGMDAVRKFCSRAMLIRDGIVEAIGSPEDIANRYTLENFEVTGKKEIKGADGYPEGLSKRVPYLKVTTPIKRVLTRDDELIFNVEYEITDDTPVSVFIAVNDETRGGSILQNGAAPISKKGKHTLTYKLPLRYFNDTNILVNAVLDVFETKERIAFTNEKNSHRFAIRNKETDNGLLRKDNDIHGQWVNHEEYMYNMKEF
jgi:ABC-2 type transport system ATP-binding protein